MITADRSGRTRTLILVVAALMVSGAAAAVERAELTPETTSAPELYCDWVRSPMPGRPGEVRCFSRPIKYVDAEGELQRIIVDLEQDGTVLRETRNTIQFAADSETKACRYSVGKYSVTMTLVSRGVDAAKEDALITAAKPVQLKIGKDAAHWSGALGAGLAIEYQVGYGVVKETITLASVPELGDAKEYLITWGWRADGLTPVVDGDTVAWLDADKVVVMRFRAPKAVDAKGAAIPIAYRLGESTLSVAVDAAALGGAAYPITIDPTVETDDASESATTYQDSWDGDEDGYRACYIKIPLPDLTGFTSIDSATLYIYNATTIAVGYNVYCDVVGAWTSSSSAATLAALSFGAAVDTGSGARTVGWDTHNVKGAAGTNGVAKAYNDDASPNPITVKLLWTENSPAQSSAWAHALYMGLESSAAIWSQDTGTYPPYISISYSAGGGSIGARPGIGSCGPIGGY